jgi:hypothetical protein
VLERIEECSFVEASGRAGVATLERYVKLGKPVGYGGIAVGELS